MIPSPTEKGVVMIGGSNEDNSGNSSGSLVLKYSHALLELSGDSRETLEWKILDQKLEHPGDSLVTFSISNDIAATLIMKSIGSSVQN